MSFPRYGITVPFNPAGGQARIDAIYDELAAAGIKGARVDCLWASSDSPEGVIKYDVYGAGQIDRLYDRGFSIIGMLNYTPGWTNGWLGKPYPPCKTIYNQPISSGADIRELVLNEPDTVYPVYLLQTQQTDRIVSEVITEDFKPFTIYRTARPFIKPSSMQLWVDEGAGFREWKRCERISKEPNLAEVFEAEYDGKIWFRDGRMGVWYHGKTPRTGSKIMVSYEAHKWQKTVTPVDGKILDEIPEGVTVSCRVFNPEPWTKWVKAFVKHYKDKVKFWEIWNEPDQSWMWNAGQFMYAKMLETASIAIKEVDPDAKVLNGGYAHEREQVLESLYKHTSRKHFDFTAWHPYHFQKTPPDDTWVKIASDPGRKIMRLNGDDDGNYDGPHAKKTFFTETGVSSSPDFNCNEEIQAEWAMRLLMRASNLPWVAGVIWWHTIDTAEVWSPYNSNSGLYRNDGSPKPVLDAYKLMAGYQGVMVELTPEVSKIVVTVAQPCELSYSVLTTPKAIDPTTVTAEKTCDISITNEAKWVNVFGGEIVSVKALDSKGKAVKVVTSKH